ncbi:hypothetical protein Pmani_008701 [Petrolisthes manimaculis]|uniref:Uncharacterized protein n=1 Tax=Petrolisthes manimaculis TaxID=1843537 RepID=A0AAE1Q8F8_9EUCA|nr:hypothetical protein Pmani_008701 [Petrolisthes manimaculis]
MSPATSMPQQEDDITALGHTPSRIHQHPGSQHHKPKMVSLVRPVKVTNVNDCTMIRQEAKRVSQISCASQ